MNANETDRLYYSRNCSDGGYYRRQVYVQKEKIGEMHRLQR